MCRSEVPFWTWDSLWNTLKPTGFLSWDIGPDELPAFFTRKSGFKLPHRIDDAGSAAAVFKAMADLGYPGGAVVANPIPEEFSMDEDFIQSKIDEALKEAAG